MIKDYPVQTIYKQLYCDICGHRMVKDNYKYTSEPPEFSYICEKCGHRFITSELCNTVVHSHMSFDDIDINSTEDKPLDDANHVNLLHRIINMFKNEENN